MAEAAKPTGSIYDLGYRPYEGARLGRRHAFAALTVYSFRAVFGIGRSIGNQAFPVGLSLIALGPATAQLAVAAISPTKVDLITPENYYRIVETIIALFCCAVAPELVGRDQRNRTLPLYFSRTLVRFDYVSAKVVAFFAAILFILLLPQAVLLVGAAVSTSAVLGYVRDHADQLPPILGGAVVMSVFLSSISLAIGCHTPKRALGTGAILAYFIILTSVGRTLVQTTTGEAQRWVILLSPLDICEGVVYWLFRTTPEAKSAVEMARQSGLVYLSAAIAYTVVSLGILYRRFLRMVV